MTSSEHQALSLSNLHQSDDKQTASPSVSLSLPYEYTLEDVQVLEESIEYVGGLFPRGRLSGLVGKSSDGKSLVTTLSALSITDNIPFSSIYPCNNKDTGRALILDSEGRLRTLKQRVLKAGGTPKKFLIAAESCKILGYESTEDRKAIEECIEAYCPEFFVVDSFAAFSSEDENTFAVMPCLKWLVMLCVKYNMAGVITQLVNKSEQKDGRITMNSVRGFSGITQMTELIWAIDNPSSNPNGRRLYQVKNNICEKDDKDYFFVIDDCGIEFVDELPLKSAKTRRNEDHYQFFLNNIDEDNSLIADMAIEMFALPCTGIQKDNLMRSFQRWRKRLDDNDTGGRVD